MNSSILTPRRGALLCGVIHTFSTIQHTYHFRHLRTLVFFRGMFCNFWVLPPRFNHDLQTFSVKAADLYSRFLYLQDDVGMAMRLPTNLKLEISRHQWNAEIEFLEHCGLLKITSPS